MVPSLCRYQFYLDDLPIWGMVGELTSSDVEEADESKQVRTYGCDRWLQ